MTPSNILPFINPATGQQFGQMSASSTEDVAHYLSDLRHTAKSWSRKSVGERVWALDQFKEYLIDHADEIASVLNQDCGKTMQDGLVEVFITVDNLNKMIHHAPRWLRRRRLFPGLYFFKRYHQEQVPYGTVAVIGPWNYPFVQVLTPVLAALAAGNTVIIKPSEITPAVGKLIDDLFATFPDLHPYVRVLHGGPEIGKTLVSAPPDLIFLTGSLMTAQKIGEVANRNMIPFITELGGKDAMIVLEDADIQQAAKWGVWAANYNSGQVCMSVERVYVVDAVYERFVAAVQEEIKKFKIGYTAEKESPYDCGPLTAERQLTIVKDHVADALAGGAKVLSGGRHEGLFYEPTILVDVNPSMKVIREESFGPIMPIVKVDDEEEAIRMANDSEYGLCAYIWSGNQQRAEEVGSRMQVGTVVVNDAMAHYAVSSLPFGGVKKSGNGRIHGQQELLQFTQTKGYAVGPTPQPYDIATIFRAPGHYHHMKLLMKLAFGSGRQRVEAIMPPAPVVEKTDRTRPVFNHRLNGLGKTAAVVGGITGAALALLAISRRR